MTPTDRFAHAIIVFSANFRPNSSHVRLCLSASWTFLLTTSALAQAQRILNEKFSILACCVGYIFSDTFCVRVSEELILVCVDACKRKSSCKQNSASWLTSQLFWDMPLEGWLQCKNHKNIFKLFDDLLRKKKTICWTHTKRNSIWAFALSGFA